ncbi:Reverse transcriptase Ty1/copia-type domain-containing protein [Abeliophyllum distichum]|uniref:Reverse transcriptase Ty1/copia-type domain-containing protein n=1 Tax=Abeliophyllum distichum TaxID=126358 RepID=A0ABD1U002_9LAMI
MDIEEFQETTNIDQLDEPIIEPTFDETHIGSGEPLVEPAFDETHIGSGEPLVPEHTTTLRKSSRVIRPLRRYDLLITNDALIIEEDEPTTYAESKSNIDSKRWQEAMESEMNSMYENKVWTLIDPPEAVKLIGCK